MSRGSVLPEGMRLAGEIRGQGDLVVAGTIEGPVAIDGHLTIEVSGVVRGEVKARAIVLRGTLTGHAVADETIRLEAGARMVGDARAERVSVVEGALLRGRITMTGAQAARRSSAGQVIAPAAISSAPTSSGSTASPAAIAPRPAAPVPAIAPVPSVAVAPRGAPPVPVASGALVEPRERAEPRAPRERAEPRGPRERGEPRPPREQDLETRTTDRFVRRGESLVPEADATITRPRERRPPEPVIPGVGRQRARRKDGGMAS